MCLKIIYLFQKSRRRPWTSIGRHLFYNALASLKQEGSAKCFKQLKSSPSKAQAQPLEPVFNLALPNINITLGGSTFPG